LQREKERERKRKRELVEEFGKRRISSFFCLFCVLCCISVGVVAKRRERERERGNLEEEEVWEKKLWILLLL